MADQTSPTEIEMMRDVMANTLRRDGPGLYGITGPAGAGKTFAAGQLAQIARCSIYSADYGFIGNSEERKVLLLEKQMRSIEDYMDAVNQFNWWDWGSILSDIEDLRAGTKIRIAAPYDRTTGGIGASVTLPATETLVYEGAILGPPFLVNLMARIFFLCVDVSIRFQRSIERDRGRRNFNEILARFLITEYSETLYYRNLFDWAEDRIVFIDGITGMPCGKPEFPSDIFVPLRVNLPSPE